MKNNNPFIKFETKKKLKESFYNIIRNKVVIFFDMAIRSILMFLGVSIMFLIVTSVFKLKISSVWLFVIAFFLSLIISPYLTKIQFADSLLTKYEDWLKKMIGS